MFFNWWLRQLSSLLPDGVVRGFSDRANIAILEIGHDTASLLIKHRGTTSCAARASADAAGFQQLAQALAARGPGETPHLLVMRLPPSSVLHKRLSVPLAARRDLISVLGFELDRETPFTRDEVHWDYAVRRTDPAHGKIDVDLFIVPRPFIDPVIEAARHAGLEPIGVEIETGADEPGLIRLGTQKRWQWLRSQRSLVALAGAAGILAVVAIAIPFIRQQWSLASANAAVNSLTAQAQEAASLRQSVDQLMTTQDFLNKERSRNGSALNALAATTRLVPDDSHLTALSLRASRLTVTGVSPSAAKLVDLLAQSKEFREPAFDSPVVQDDTGSLEAFTISATLAPAGGS